MSDEAHERAIQNLWEYAQAEWNWGSDDYDDVKRAVDVVLAAAAPSSVREGGEGARYRRALVSIQSHAMMDDNAASMVWTARVALYPGTLEEALRAVPAHLREVLAARFEEATDAA
jgi:hypothetical protein